MLCGRVWVYVGVRTCELFLCFVAIVRVRVYYVDFFVFFVLRHLWVSQVLTPRQSRKSRTIMANFPVFQETEGEWPSVRTVEILGVRIPAYFTTDPQLLYDFITNFQTKPDDVFIVSYPKSGNRELKHRRFWATNVNRKSRLLLFDVYFTLLIQKVKF